MSGLLSLGRFHRSGASSDDDENGDDDFHDDDDSDVDVKNLLPGQQELSRVDGKSSGERPLTSPQAGKA